MTPEEIKQFGTPRYIGPVRLSKGLKKAIKKGEVIVDEKRDESGNLICQAMRYKRNEFTETDGGLKILAERDEKTGKITLRISS